MDRGRSWLVLLCCFLNYGLTLSLLGTQGVFMVPLLDQFHSSKQKTAFALTIGITLMGYLGPISGWLYKLFGCRALLMTGSVISCVGFYLSSWVTNIDELICTQAVSGVGLGLVIVPSSAILTEYFDKYRSLAASIMPIGLPLFSFILPQLNTLLMDWYGWRGAMCILAGLALQIFVSGAVTKDRNVSGSTSGKYFDYAVIKNPKCWCVWMIMFGKTTVAAVVVIFINAILLEKGIEVHLAALLMSLPPITNITVRTVASFLLHRCKIKVKLMVLVLALLSLCLLSILISFATSQTALAIILLLSGVSDGLISAMFSMVQVGIFIPQHYPLIVGGSSVFASTAGLLSINIAGAIADKFNLISTLYCGSALGLVGIMAAVILLVVTHVVGDAKQPST